MLSRVLCVFLAVGPAWADEPPSTPTSATPAPSSTDTAVAPSSTDTAVAPVTPPATPPATPRSEPVVPPAAPTSSPAASTPSPNTIAPPSTTTPTPPSTTPTTQTTQTTPPARRIGDPVPLTLREPTMRAGSLMVGARYGLVGTGPTRFVDDVRVSLTDHLELRTALSPWPTALMVRGRLGSQQGDLGALLLEGGLAYFDAGVRIVPDTGEPNVGIRAHFEGSAGWTKHIAERTAVAAFVHYRERLSMLDDDDQRAVAVDAHVTYDLLDALAVSAGVGVASTLGTPVREVVVNFVETDRPGISHLLARDDGGEQSVTIPLTMTYGRVDSFDVDRFCTPRVWPPPGVLFGAGLRFRIEPLPRFKR